MIPAETLSAFFLASVLLALAPGPDNIFVLTQSALYGKASGLAVVGGLCTGLVVHTLGVALGVAVVFQTSATAFTALKLAGAGYLLYLAWQTFHAPAMPSTAARPTPTGQFRLYRRGVFMNLTNPKVSLFFLAFLPQFADPSRGPLPAQLGLLGATFIVATVVVFGGIALLAGTVGIWLQRSATLQRGLNWLAGSIFIGLALTLAVTRR